MYHILCDGVYYGNFNSEVDAEDWLKAEGWVKDNWKWHFHRPGRATLFAVVENKVFIESMSELLKKMTD